MIRKKILIPIYNDWSSLEILLNNLDEKLKQDDYEIIIVNDNSSQKKNFSFNKFKKIKNIKVLNLLKNLGSQGCIAVGLKFLSNLNESFHLTIMDGDGEDDPKHVNKLFDLSEKFPDLIITSNRLNRQDGKLFQFFYKIHLVLTFLLTFKWINFGNFSCLHSSSLDQVQNNDEVGIAVSSAIVKNCYTYKSPSKRLKRYKDNSKVSYFGLALHSLRVLSVFYKTVIFSSLFYFGLSLLLNFTTTTFNYILFVIILFLNIFLFMIYRSHKITENLFNKVLSKDQ